MKKKLLIVMAASAVFLAACGAKKIEPSAPIELSAADVLNTEILETQEEAVRDISLLGDRAEFSCGGVKASGAVVTITAPGEYRLSGELREGQIIVDTGSAPEKVNIILNGVSLSNSSDAAFFVKQAEKVNIKLASGTENRITSGTEEMMAAADDSASGAAIVAKDDIDIKGDGKLLVFGYINNGISCKNDIDIDEGEITVVAANNGIKGEYSVEINGGTVSVNCGNDALKSTCIDRQDKGFVKIEGGVVSLTARGDGISAEKDVIVNAGELIISAAKKPLKSISGEIRVDENVAKVVILDDN